MSGISFGLSILYFRKKQKLTFNDQKQHDYELTSSYRFFSLLTNFQLEPDSIVLLPHVSLGRYLLHVTISSCECLFDGIF